LNDGECEFIQLLQRPIVIIMEHLIEMPTHEHFLPRFAGISSPQVYWRLNYYEIWSSNVYFYQV